MVPILDCVRAYCTLGEIATCLRGVFASTSDCNRFEDRGRRSRKARVRKDAQRRSSPLSRLAPSRSRDKKGGVGMAERKIRVLVAKPRAGRP